MMTTKMMMKMIVMMKMMMKMKMMMIMMTITRVAYASHIILSKGTTLVNMMITIGG